MPTITFEGKNYDCSDDETLLDSLTRHGVLLPSGCRGGSCHACLIKAHKGSPPPLSQSGLKNTLIEQNYFLPCICKPTEDLEIGLASNSTSYQTTLIEKKSLNETIALLRFAKPKDFEYHPGQFINLLQTETNVTRSYSLASTPDENFLELHVKRVPDGKMSNWLCDVLNVGDEISFFGPSGNCFYMKGDIQQPLVLAGTGTGLAPLFGILRDAIHQQHQGEIHIFHASLAAEGLYYTEELRDISQSHENLTYIPCVLHGEAPEGGLKGSVDQLVVNTIKDGKGIRAYLCGDAPVVDAMQKSIFFAGASMQDIYADAFAFTPQG